MLAQSEALAQFNALVAELHRRKECQRYEQSLIEFIEYIWPVVEPQTPFVRGWAIEAICEHLQAVTRGEITRLLINVPPGFAKSLITDVFWPMWEWGPRSLPHLRYVCASYASHLTLRDNMKCRDVIRSDRYRHFWGGRFNLSVEQFTKTKFANDKTGWKFATSVSGVTGGERGDRFIIDDANNPQDMESAVVRATTNHWFVEVVPDRLNSITRSAIVAIQQRLHEDDISGVALSRDLGFVHLMIPMEYDSSRHCRTAIGWEDPRGLDEDGSSLFAADDSGAMAPRDARAAAIIEMRDRMPAWPERFPAQALEILKQKGPYAWAGQYQQSPEPRGGGIFKRDWWQRWDPPADAKGRRWFPTFDMVIASLDTAYTAKEENDPSALTVWGLFPDKETGHPRVMLMDAWRKRLELHGPDIQRHPGETDYSFRLRTQPDWGLVEWVADSCRQHRVDRLLIEAKAAGLTVAQEIQRLYGNALFGVQLIEPKGDKTARAYSVQHLFSANMVYAAVKDGAWTDRAMMVIDEAASFPKAAHDDLVDTLTQALKHMRDNHLLDRRDVIEQEREEALRFKPKASPLYPT